ncbi:TPR-like protein [Peniophora sp. CONT]|nr:TPR-like protein [Peniophora sp. CONT]
MSYQQKYRAGDPSNPHDPAAITGDYDRDVAGVQQRMANNPAMGNLLQNMMGDPTKLDALAKMIKDDLKDAKSRGETMEERMMREKREFARDDAMSEKLKGNEAMRSGDVKLAFTYYKACTLKSAHEPVYWLNIAAACLKLKMYDWAEQAAHGAIERDGNNPPKALFRRAQARRFLGKLDNAAKDIQDALNQLPSDATLQKERDEIRALQAKSPEELQQWLQANPNQTLEDVFGISSEEEFDKVAEKLREKESKAT